MIKRVLFPFKIKQTTEIEICDPCMGGVEFTGLLNGNWYGVISSAHAGKGWGEREVSLSLIHASQYTLFLKEGGHMENSPMWVDSGKTVSVDSGKVAMILGNNEVNLSGIHSITHDMLFEGPEVNVFPGDNPHIIVCCSGYGDGGYGIYTTHEGGIFTGFRVEFISIRTCPDCGAYEGICHCADNKEDDYHVYA